jgi:diketogulonate reductase-like aldo/keto reductase|tara:strand:+ start:571 stop:921 length:351 start_codon:yes stop_codon:yes gene_type:complete
VGITTEGRRDKFYLATKVRIEGKEAGENQIAQSFQNFNTYYIDRLQVHNMIDVQTHLPTLERLKEEGKAGLIGVTAMVNETYDEVMDRDAHRPDRYRPDPLQRCPARGRGKAAAPG